MQDCQIAGTPLELSVPSHDGNIHDGRVNSPGYGKNLKDWEIRSQAPCRCERLVKQSFTTTIVSRDERAVQRLNVSRQKMLKI